MEGGDEEEDGISAVMQASAISYSFGMKSFQRTAGLFRRWEMAALVVERSVREPLKKLVRSGRR
jgi:hypothetical protein